jgi:von Willebrand factor A domain-containing protein 8
VVRPESFFAQLLPAGAPPAWEGVLAHAAAMRVLDADPQYAGVVPPILGEDQLAKVFALLQRTPDLSPARALHAVNPHRYFAERPASLVARSLDKFQLGDGPAARAPASGKEIAAASAALPSEAIVTNGQPYVLESTRAGSAASTVDVVLRNTITNQIVTFSLEGHPELTHGNSLVNIDSQQRLLSEILLSLSAGDVCLVGNRGVGKSALVDAAAACIGATCTHVMLHKDMTARDLLQQRVTEPNGDTAWRPAPLVQAAIQGRSVGREWWSRFAWDLNVLSEVACVAHFDSVPSIFVFSLLYSTHVKFDSVAVLDGVHRLDPGALSALRRLAHDRELHLPDGSRLVAAARLQEICHEKGLTYPPPVALGYHAVHPAFRMVALGEPPSLQGASWLTDETQTMLLTVTVPALALGEQRLILAAAAPHLAPPTLDAIMRVAHVFAGHTAANTAPTAALSLSLRQLLRLARRMQAHPADCLYSNIERLCLARFLPRTARAALKSALDQAGLAPLPVSAEVLAVLCVCVCVCGGGGGSFVGKLGLGGLRGQEIDAPAPFPIFLS